MFKLAYLGEIVKADWNVLGAPVLLEFVSVTSQEDSLKGVRHFLLVIH